MSSVSPLDASILALLSKVPKRVKASQEGILKEARQKLLERLSPEAREIGEAVLADDGAELAVSTPAQETASKMKSWARANKSRPESA